MLMEAKKHGLLLLKRLRYNLRAEMAYPLNCMLQIFGMLLNNAILIASWYFIFLKFETIRGFTFPMMMGLYAVCMVSFGMVYFAFGNVVNLNKLLLNNELDAFLTQPKHLLLNVLSAKSDLTALADVVSGIVLFLLFFRLGLLPLFFIGCLCASVLILSFSIVLETLSFRLKLSDYLNYIVYQFMQNIAAYPSGIFPLGITVIIVTVFPTFFISNLPALLLTRFHLAQGLLLLAVSAAWLVLSVLFFKRSMRKYESGSSMTTNT